MIRVWNAALVQFVMLCAVASKRSVDGLNKAAANKVSEVRRRGLSRIPNLRQEFYVIAEAHSSPCASSSTCVVVFATNNKTYDLPTRDSRIAQKNIFHD